MSMDKCPPQTMSAKLRNTLEDEFEFESLMVCVCVNSATCSLLSTIYISHSKGMDASRVQFRGSAESG